MFNSLDVLDDLVPVSELSNGRTTAVLNKADRAPVIIIKRNKPSYVLMGINDYQDLLDRLEDTEDARLAEKRIEDNNGRATIPNADLMAELGLTEEDINPQYQDFATSVDSLKDGKIDAAFIVAGVSERKRNERRGKKKPRRTCANWARPNRNRCSKASPKSARIRCHPAKADTANRCATRTEPIWPDYAKSNSGTLESEWYTSRFSRKEPWSSSS